MTGKGVIIQLDRPRVFRLTTNALCTMQQLTGIKPSKFQKSDPDILEVRALLFAGLWEDDKNMTLEKAGQLMDEYGAEAIETAITQAMGEQTGEPEKNA